MFKCTYGGHKIAGECSITMKNLNAFTSNVHNLDSCKILLFYLSLSEIMGSRLVCSFPEVFLQGFPDCCGRLYCSSRITYFQQNCFDPQISKKKINSLSNSCQFIVDVSLLKKTLYVTVK